MAYYMARDSKISIAKSSNDGGAMTTEPMTRANIFLPPEMIARLKEQKERTGVPVAEFVRRAIEAALQKSPAD
jgi:hypothetical protein